MKFFKTFIISISLTIAANTAFAQYFYVNHNKYKRTFLLHLPKSYTVDKKYPLVIALHGGFGSALNLEEQSGLSIMADKENFIVVYPEGVEGRLMTARTWNAGWCCGFSSKSNIDDVGFIDKMLDKVIKDYPVDTNKVYVTGMSNGGFMAYRLACELSDRIAAIAPVAASMSMEECNPVLKMPIIHFHSYNDKSVPIEGGIGEGISKHYNLPLDSLLKIWSVRNGCSDKVDKVINNSQYTFLKNNNNDKASEIECYISKDGGHSWPGGKQTKIGDPSSTFVNANVLMWQFFKRHTLADKNK